MARLKFAIKYRDKAQKLWDKVLWTDETKINLYQSDGKANVWRKKGSAHDTKHTSSSVKHGGGNVMASACMASSGTGSLIFIDDVTHDGSSKMNSEVYRNILSAILKRRCNQTDREILHHAARQQPKTHFQNNQGVHQVKEVEGFRLAKSIFRLKPYWACILPAKEETEGRNPPKQTTTERGCGECLEHHKKRMQKFGDVSGTQAWCSYCKQRICN